MSELVSCLDDDVD